jgi:hypothetical protein
MCHGNSIQAMSEHDRGGGVGGQIVSSEILTVECAKHLKGLGLLTLR